MQKIKIKVLKKKIYYKMVNKIYNKMVNKIYYKMVNKINNLLQ